MNSYAQRLLSINVEMAVVPVEAPDPTRPPQAAVFELVFYRNPSASRELTECTEQFLTTQRTLRMALRSHWIPVPNVRLSALRSSPGIRDQLTDRQRILVDHLLAVDLENRAVVMDELPEAPNQLLQFVALATATLRGQPLRVSAHIDFTDVVLEYMRYDIPNRSVRYMYVFVPLSTDSGTWPLIGHRHGVVSAVRLQRAPAEPVPSPGLRPIPVSDAGRHVHQDGDEADTLSSLTAVSVTNDNTWRRASRLRVYVTYVDPPYDILPPDKRLPSTTECPLCYERTVDGVWAVCPAGHGICFVCAIRLENMTRSLTMACPYCRIRGSFRYICARPEGASGHGDYQPIPQHVSGRLTTRD
jgi:hypothetical protein